MECSRSILMPKVSSKINRYFHAASGADGIAFVAGVPCQNFYRPRGTTKHAAAQEEARARDLAPNMPTPALVNSGRGETVLENGVLEAIYRDDAASSN